MLDAAITWTLPQRAKHAFTNLWLTERFATPALRQQGLASLMQCHDWLPSHVSIYHWLPEQFSTPALQLQWLVANNAITWTDECEYHVSSINGPAHVLLSMPDSVGDPLSIEILEPTKLNLRLILRALTRSETSPSAGMSEMSTSATSYMENWSQVRPFRQPFVCRGMCSNFLHCKPTCHCSCIWIAVLPSMIAKLSWTA